MSASNLNRWVGKTALVTGASAGIGVGIVEALVENGINVVGVARRLEKLQELSKNLKNFPGKFAPYQADFSKEDEIKKTFQYAKENFGPVHILINNAGLNIDQNLIDGDSNTWRKVMDLNVIGLAIATNEAIRMMREFDVNGQIVHINSIAGHSIPLLPGVNMYPASKHALTALTETLRRELNGIGSKIKVSSVSPGLTVSELTVLNETLSKEKMEMLKKRPILQPRDIGDAVIYVLSTPEHVQIKELTIKPVGEPY